MKSSKKIEILENILKYLIEKKSNGDRGGLGLCILIHYYSGFIDTRCEFKDFSNKNAQEIAGAREGSVWWNRLPYDFDNRIKFVSWMIERIRTGKEGTDVRW